MEATEIRRDDIVQDPWGNQYRVSGVYPSENTLTVTSLEYGDRHEVPYTEMTVVSSRGV